MAKIDSSTTITAPSGIGPLVADTTKTAHAADVVKKHVANTVSAAKFREILKVKLGGATFDSSQSEALKECMIKEILVWKLGDSVVNDDNFTDMIQDITQQLSKNKNLSELMNSITDELHLISNAESPGSSNSK